MGSWFRIVTLSPYRADNFVFVVMVSDWIEGPIITCYMIGKASTEIMHA